VPLTEYIIGADPVAKPTFAVHNVFPVRSSIA